MLRWRLCGIDFCIQPSFWLMSALFGYLVVGMGMRMEGVEMLKYIGIWVLCTLLSVMVHELGHAVTGKIFGIPGNITLAGMGGQAAGGFDALKRWQRVLVISAGPGAGFLLLFLVVLVNRHAWNDHVWRPLDLPESLKITWTWDILDQIDSNLKRTAPYSEIMKFLCWMNLFWNLINLIPIIPLDGGMLMREGCTLVAPVQGLRIAYGLSFLLAAGLAVYCIVSLTVRRDLPTLIDPFFGILMFGMMAVQNLTALAQARGNPQTPQRSPYYQDD